MIRDRESIHDVDHARTVHRALVEEAVRDVVEEHAGDVSNEKDVTLFDLVGRSGSSGAEHAAPVTVLGKLCLGGHTDSEDERECNEHSQQCLAVHRRVSSVWMV